MCQFYQHDDCLDVGSLCDQLRDRFRNCQRAKKQVSHAFTLILRRIDHPRDDSYLYNY